MLEHITTFINSLLGVTLPEIVYIIIALSLVYLVLRAFLSLFNLNNKVTDFCFYVCIGYLAISQLGGLSWNLSL